MDSLFSRNKLTTGIAYSSILTITIISWCLLGRIPLTASSVGAVFIFCLGIVSWASMCRQLWPSQYSLNNYLPFGYALCSVAGLAIMMLKQGTVASALMGSLSGVFLFCIKNIVRPHLQIRSGYQSIEPGITKRSVISLVLTAMLTTFLLANQIASIRSLHNVAVTTTIKGWADVMLHANTVLSLSSLPPGQAPISTLDYTDSIVPYHYTSYILSSLFNSLSTQASPLQSFVSIVAPLGCLLMLLPFSEEALKAKSKHASIALLGTGSFIFLLYSLWVRLIGDSLLDPAWLLITAPATMYACSITLSGIQIYSNTYKQGPVSLISLVVLGFLLTVSAKIQIAHALLPMVVAIGSWVGFSLLRQKQVLRLNDSIYIPLAAVSLLAGVHLYANSILGVGRRDPAGEVITFLRDIAARTWGYANAGQTSVLNNDWLAPLLGFLTFCGPLFLIALLSGIIGPSRQSFRERVLILIIVSYVTSLLISPSMPWDDGEFLNRSWPLLWYLGAWALLDRPRFKFDRKQLQQVLITGSVIALILGWSILPAPKRESIASPSRPEDWSKSYYPTIVNSSEKKLAQDLKRSGINPYFFASSSLKNSHSKIDFDDMPSRLSALSGARPLISRVLFQKSLEVLQVKNGVDPSVESRYSQMLVSYGTACESSAGANSPIKVFQQPEAGPVQSVYVVCQDLKPPSQ